MSEYLDIKNKMQLKKIIMKKDRKINKYFNKNQSTFYFEDYLETNKKINHQKNNFFQDRIYLLFFYFFH